MNFLLIDGSLDGKALPFASPIQATIDSSSPFLTLPPSLCSALLSSFGLSLDPATGLYLVNSITHSRLQALNSTLTFGFADSTDLMKGVNITLQYATLDLVASAPIYSQPTRYLPLRESNNESTAVLGRAFLQETYFPPFFPSPLPFSKLKLKSDLTTTYQISNPRLLMPKLLHLTSRLLTLFFPKHHPHLTRHKLTRYESRTLRFHHLSCSIACRMGTICSCGLPAA
jgi:hypothetical protein